MNFLDKNGKKWEFNIDTENQFECMKIFKKVEKLEGTEQLEETSFLIFETCSEFKSRNEIMEYFKKDYALFINIGSEFFGEIMGFILPEKALSGKINKLGKISKLGKTDGKQ